MPVSGRIVTILWSAGSILTLAAFWSVEWAHPSCNIVSDGPANAAYGFPLPYMQFGGVSSLEYNVMPHVLLLDFGLQTALVYPVLRSVMRRIWRPLALSGWTLAVLAAGLFCAGLFMQVAIHSFNRSVVSIATPLASYWDYRPIGFSVDAGAYRCAPSRFWFGPVR